MYSPAARAHALPPYSSWSFYIPKTAARRLSPAHLQFFVLLKFYEKFLDYGASGAAVTSLRLRELDTPRNDNGLDAVGEPGDFWSKPFCRERLRNLVCAKQVIALNMLVEVLEGQSSQCRLS